MTACVSTKDICIIRGDDYTLDAALENGFEEVFETPGDYEGRMVIRMEQDDSLPDLLTLTSTLELVEAQNECPARVYMSFTATAAQTTALPPYDLVYYVELAGTAGGPTTRLFQGKVDIHD